LGHVLQKIFEAFEGGLAVLEPGDKALAYEPIDEGFKFQACGVEGKASSGFPVDGSEAFQRTQAETHRTQTDSDTVGDFIHGEGLRGAEEDPVDLTMGAGIPEEVGQLGKDLNEPTFKANACLGFRQWGGRCH
jgi:hypothetical protein